MNSRMLQFPGVTFHPWVGPLYGGESRFGLPLLVLGESHYGSKKDERSTLTSEVVQEWAHEKRDRFCTVIANVLTDNRGWISNARRAKAWDQIAFYNLVQSLMDGPRQPPTFRQWVDAQQPFQTVLAALKPAAVLVLGQRLDEHLLSKPDDIAFGTIVHPSSSRFAYDDNMRRFKELLEGAARRTI